LHDAQAQVGQGPTTTRYLFPDHDKFALKTPCKVPFEGDFPAVVVPSKLLDIKDQSLVVAPEQFWWEEEDSSSFLPTPLFSFLKLLRGFLIKYNQWLVEPLDILTLRLETVEGDLQKLKHYCEALEFAIGRPLSIHGDEFPDLWSGLEFLAAGTGFSPGQLVNLNQGLSAIQVDVGRLSALFPKVAGIDTRLNDVKTLCDTYDARFTRIHSILVSVKDLKKRLDL
jgi:hypothetical protein